MANYTHARIQFDQALGQTLDINQVSITEAMTGKVAAAPSVIPAVRP